MEMPKPCDGSDHRVDSKRRRSVRVRRDNLAQGGGAESVIDRIADRLLDELDAAITQQEIGPAGMPALVTANLSKCVDLDGRAIDEIDQIERDRRGGQREVVAERREVAALVGERLTDHERVAHPV